MLDLENLIGVDPFIESDMITRTGVSISKSTLADVDGLFDVVMFNHSFEHIPSPRDELRTVHAKLPDGGLCLIRFPTPSSEAWESYGVEWAQLDAPRHLTLISRSGMTLLAESCGFSVKSVIDEGQGWSLAVSELYRRGLPYNESTITSYFSSKQLVNFNKKASTANAAKRGDSVAFILARG